MTGKEACYLIRKGGYFYREKWCGYTQFKFDAGRYTKAEAEAEASVEPWHMAAIHEDDVPDEREPDKFIAGLRATIAALEARAIAAEERVKRSERYYAPEDASEVMVDAALAVDWGGEDERGTVHNIWHVMRAAISGGNKDG